MTTRKTLNGDISHAVQSVCTPEGEKAAQSFINLYNARLEFFDESFVKKVIAGNRKALKQLQHGNIPPTPMDLRKELAECVKSGVPDVYIFRMKDKRSFTLTDLKGQVPEWAQLAEQALIASDPALADKLMSLAQWNAKSAFEVAFMSAANELKKIKKGEARPSSFEYYTKWMISPLKKALLEVKSVNTPGNSLVGYGDRIPLTEAIDIAEGLEKEFMVLNGRR